ncbi:tetratricopeptide repeat protein [Lacinutrix gracilariae]|uniref:Tetratricopeptide repeat protein n=1 Tax=Lacinutrix gracilariae TaxID=1747198 RepID=A0ABW5JXJ8_9FLAO
MIISSNDIISYIERAETHYKNNQYQALKSVIDDIQEYVTLLSEPEDFARYYRIYMLYLGVYEEMNMPVLKSYLQALIDNGQVQASDFEYVCSFYDECEQSVYEDALVRYPYNDTIQLHYAFKLQNEKRYQDAILVLKYLLECYPALTEARFLLWDIQAAQLEHICDSDEEADCNELLDLASATHNKSVLKGLQLDERLDLPSQTLANMHVAMWENKSIDNKALWNSEWKHLEITDRTRMLLVDYFQSFMRYDMVAQIIKYPGEPQLPEEDYSNFEEFKIYMQDFANSGWQLAQHYYLRYGDSAYYHTKDRNVLNQCVQQGLTLNPKNPNLFVLKARAFFFVKNYKQTGEAYHEAFRNGLRMSEYLFYLLEVNSRIESWQGILDIVEQFHRRQPATLKTLFFKARALVKFSRFDEALVVLNEALEDFPLPSHSYAPWLYNLRMVVHMNNQNYTAFFEDMQSEINYYKIGDINYCSTMNLCVEALLEMNDYKECHKYAIYNHEQGQLAPELYPVFKWICYYDYLPKPDDLAPASEDNLVKNPTTFIEFRNNGLIHWILNNFDAAIGNLSQAAHMATNKAFYLKMVASCAEDSFDNSEALSAYKTAKEQAPEASDYKTFFKLYSFYNDENEPKKALETLQHSIQSYPDYTFFDFPRDEFNMMLRSRKLLAQQLEDVDGFTKYSAMFLSKDQPSVQALHDHLTHIKTHFASDDFLLHNILEELSQRDEDFDEAHSKMLKAVKTKIRDAYFT